MLCTFYTINKRTNSTALPQGGQQYNIELKDACSMIAPVIKLAVGITNLTAFNYCYLPDFNRYYFIRDWSYDRSLWFATLSEDVLATWRDRIGSSTQYILRSSAVYDGNVIDTLYPTKAGMTYTKNNAPAVFSDTLAAGCYILSTVSQMDGFGCCSYWILSDSAFRKLRQALLSNVDYLDIDSSEISEGLTKALFNPYQYMIACHWLPFSITLDPAYQFGDLSVGWWDLSLSGETAGLVSQNTDVLTFTSNVTIPKHPQAAQRGNYLNLSPYSTYSLYYPPFGEIEIDPGAIINANTLWMQTVVDAYTGQGYLYVSTDEAGSNVVAVRQAQIGVQIPLAQISYDTIDSVGELVSTGVKAIYGAAKGIADNASEIVGLLTGKETDVGSVATDVASNIGDAAASNLVKSQYKGGAGSVAVYSTEPYILGQFMQIVDEDNDDRGRPLCQMRQISSIPGYIMVADPDVFLPATQAEIDTVKRYMASGFFFE